MKRVATDRKLTKYSPSALRRKCLVLHLAWDENDLRTVLKVPKRCETSLMYNRTWSNIPPGLRSPNDAETDVVPSRPPQREDARTATAGGRADVKYPTYCEETKNTFQREEVTIILSYYNDNSDTPL